MIRIITHSMPDERPPAPRKCFTYALFQVLIGRGKKAKPLPRWLCPRPLATLPAGRVVTKIGITAPIVDTPDMGSADTQYPRYRRRGPCLT